MRQINRGIIHTTATKPGWMAGTTVQDKVKEIDRWHRVDNGWRAIGYHFVIDRDGAVGRGRPLSQAGAHVRGHNADSIGIALVGGHGGAATDAFSDHYTPEQERSLRALMAELETDFPGIKWSGHNDYAAKGCPCFKVSDFVRKPEHWLPALINAILSAFGVRT